MDGCGQSPETGLALGPGLRYSASAGLFAYGVSRLTLVAIWAPSVATGDAVSMMVRAASYFFASSTGLASVALALVIFHEPFLTGRHVRLLGLLLLSFGVRVMVIELNNLLYFSYPVFLSLLTSFLASIAYSILSIYLSVGLLRGSLTLGRSTFTALALLAVASLLRSVQLDYLVLDLLDGLVNPTWLRQLLYAVSMGLAFTAFVSAYRRTPIDLHDLTKIREYALLRGAVLLYGLGDLIVFTDIYLLQFDEFMARAALYLGTVNYIATVYLWPLIDIVFPISIIAFAISMRQIRSTAGNFDSGRGK